jgi:uncharacterized protein DUF2800
VNNSHHTRAHAAWPASATARNTTCAGAMAMATLAGPELESEAAAWGTACHELIEKTARKENASALDFLGEVQKTEAYEFIVDEEMAAAAQEHLDYCFGRVKKYFDETGEMPQWWIERNFSFAKLNPPFEAGGTGDFIIYFRRWRLLEIVDFKGGRGVVVEVKSNGQQRSYGLGAMLEFPEFDVEIVRSTIVQPRAPHKDGRIRSEEIHVADLVDWTSWLIGKMNRAKVASVGFDAIGGTRNRVEFDNWAETFLTTGACTFCPAEGFCPKRRKEALAAAGQKAVDWFEDPSASPPVPTNAPAISSAEELGHTLDGLEALESWIKAVRAHAHTRAERGEKIPGWMLAKKIGNRAFIEENEAKLAEKIWKDLKLPFEQIFDKPMIKSVAQIEKVLGSRKTELAKLEGELWHKPVKGTNLVSETKTTRTPAKSKPEQHFETIE